MAHPNKRKGNRAELLVAKWLQRCGWIHAERSRAGWTDDRGDIDGMSICFEPVIDEWEYNRDTDEMVRTLKEVRLFEVSFVAYPAYSATTVGLRDLLSEDKVNELYQAREAAKRSQQAPTEAVVETPPPAAGPILAKYRCL